MGFKGRVQGFREREERVRSSEVETNFNVLKKIGKKKCLHCDGGFASYVSITMFLMIYLVVKELQLLSSQMTMVITFVSDMMRIVFNIVARNSDANLSSIRCKHGSKELDNSNGALFVIYIYDHGIEYGCLFHG
ncbi:hypothetical protein SADUNF_Sadunf16G0167200 [Salix dunnii]|uniref:Uncharacterized protein n=1 Tax=Salix dunnii TaxID=1413687 RepID=A0A835J906_9ROSI|nr:hypothetical protein SADUNF_Sadunf16G0167200 [Salix dunnii]